VSTLYFLPILRLSLRLWREIKHQQKVGRVLRWFYQINRSRKKWKI